MDNVRAKARVQNAANGNSYTGKIQKFTCQVRVPEVQFRQLGQVANGRGDSSCVNATMENLSDVHINN